MADYLLIRGGPSERVLDVLAVAADLSENPSIQVDVAVPAALVPLAKLSKVVRRVVPIKPFTPPKLSEVVSKGGWKDKLVAVTKTVASAANRNMCDYLAVAEELRLVHYNAVFDFDATGFSLAVARAAKANKIIGFAPECMSNAIPGAMLMYHDTRPVPRNLNETERCRYLVARYLDYPPDLPVDWKLHAVALPEWAPTTPFVLAGGDIPKPFAEILTAAGLTIVGNVEKAHICPSSLSPASLVALASAAVATVGNGLFTAIAAATSAKTFFIGAEKALPLRAILIDTPTALSSALERCVTAATSLPVMNTPESPSSSDSTSGSLQLKK